MCFVISVFLLILAPIDQVYGSPGGAPTAACGTMTPGHGAPVQTSLAPFMTEMPNGVSSFCFKFHFTFIKLSPKIFLSIRLFLPNSMLYC